ncbi:MAG: hypothetical protein IRY98_02915, partial [Alicyclobacillaceae bacterium]|nr:hypothetical protein [Alicyclobacillaceae bacterium]
MSNIRQAAFLLLGMVLGASGWMIVTVREMEKLHYTIEQYKLQNDRMTDELNGLRAKLHQQPQERKVRTVQIDVQTDDHFAEIAIIRFAKDQTKNLVGKTLQSLDDHPDLITGLLDGRTVQVDGHTWTVRVRAIVISETLHLYLAGVLVMPQP